MQHRVAIAHGIMMGLAFAILFPLGAIWMRLLHFRGLVWFHAGWQLFAYLIALAAFGLGVWLAVVTDQVRISTRVFHADSSGPGITAGYSNVIIVVRFTCGLP